MDSLNQLMNSLSPYFKCNKARLYCLSAMLLALISVRTVNLRELAVAFAGKALLDSKHRRLRRFVSLFKIDFIMIARWIFSLYISESEKIYLTIDRTNWYWGKSKINILTLAIAYEGMAIPILWKALDKAGNASAKEHIQIIDRFVKIFGVTCIEGVLGDREFASQELFTWCCRDNQVIPFYIRVKDNAHVKIFKGKGHAVKKLFNQLNPKEHTPYMNPVTLYGTKVYVVGSRSESGELMVVVTNQAPNNAIAIYLRRWEIETLFSCLKGRGFNFEETRLTDQDNVEKLMAVLAMAAAWVHKVGEWQTEKKPIRFKKFRNGQRRPHYSYFRYGLDFLRETILQISDRFDDFIECVALLPSNKNELEAEL